MNRMINDVAIIGCGPAGFSATLYLNRAKIKPIIYGQLVGGNLTYINKITNYTGIKSNCGIQLVDNMLEQIVQYNNQFTYTDVINVTKKDNIFIVQDQCGNIKEFKTVIVATGTNPRFLDLPNFQKLIGKGISFCGLCDGCFCQGKNVVIVGGGNSAIHQALYLRDCTQENVYIVHRNQNFRADKVVLDEAKKHFIEWLTNSNIIQLGQNQDGTLKYVKTENCTIDNCMLFCRIGSIPSTNFLPNQIKNQNGYIQTIQKTTKTVIDGLFSCGDCANPYYQQAIIASGDGAKAAIDCMNYLKYN